LGVGLQAPGFALVRLLLIAEAQMARDVWAKFEPKYNLLLKKLQSLYNSLESKRTDGKLRR
jgi:hypothetical protein